MKDLCRARSRAGGAEGEASHHPLRRRAGIGDTRAARDNFELTSYTFDGPGRHELSWRVDDLVSNTLTVEVREAWSAA